MVVMSKAFKGHQGVSVFRHSWCSSSIFKALSSLPFLALKNLFKVSLSLQKICPSLPRAASRRALSFSSLSHASVIFYFTVSTEGG